MSRFSAPPPPIPRPTTAKAQHPSGWEPRVDTVGDSAAIITQPSAEASADEALLLLGSNLDPEEWAISSEVQTRRWQQKPGDEWLYYYKFNATRRNSTFDPGWEDAIARLAKHKPKRPDPRPVAHARVFYLADTQAGKGEGGGTAALELRVEHFLDTATAIVKKEKPDAVYLMCMGDLVEMCSGNYASQPFSVDMDQRQQERFVRRMLLKFVELVAPHTPRLVLATTPSNHGENRQGKKAITPIGDSRDMAILEAIEEACRMSPAYSHVSFVIPDDEVATVLDVAGTIVAITHGHYFGNGANPQAKAANWWKGQSLGRHPAGDADVLVSAHYHSAASAEMFGRLWFQCPSMDGGSKWFTDSTGEHSRSGFLTMRIDETGVAEHGCIRSPVPQ